MKSLQCLAVAALMFSTIFVSPASAATPPEPQLPSLGELDITDGTPTITLNDDIKDCISRPTTYQIPWTLNENREQGNSWRALLEIDVLQDHRVIDVQEIPISWSQSPYQHEAEAFETPTITIPASIPGEVTTIDIKAFTWDDLETPTPKKVDVGAIELDCQPKDIPEPEPLECGLPRVDGVDYNGRDPCQTACQALDYAALQSAIPLESWEIQQLEVDGSLCSDPCEPSDPDCGACDTDCNPCPEGDCAPCLGSKCDPCAATSLLLCELVPVIVECAQNPDCPNIPDPCTRNSNACQIVAQLVDCAQDPDCPDIPETCADQGLQSCLDAVCANAPDGICAGDPCQSTGNVCAIIVQLVQCVRDPDCPHVRDPCEVTTGICPIVTDLIQCAQDPDCPDLPATCADNGLQACIDAACNAAPDGACSGDPCLISPNACNIVNQLVQCIQDPNCPHTPPPCSLANDVCVIVDQLLQCTQDPGCPDLPDTCADNGLQDCLDQVCQTAPPGVCTGDPCAITTGICPIIIDLIQCIQDTDCPDLPDTCADQGLDACIDIVCNAAPANVCAPDPCQNADCNPDIPPPRRIHIDLGGLDLSDPDEDLVFSGYPVKPASLCIDDGDSGSGGSVDHVVGEFMARVTPLHVSTEKGPSFSFDMTYRSQSPGATHGALGYRWDFTYGKHLVYNQATNDVIRYDGEGYYDTYTWDAASGTYLTPPPRYDKLTVTKVGSTIESMEIMDRYGTVERYDSQGRLAAMTDRNGNEMQFYHDLAGRLERIVDTHGREVTVSYDGARISGLTDSADRHVTFHYSPKGTLTSIEMPEGVTQRFTYSEDYQLLTIEDGEGQVYIRNEYDEFNRVIEQHQGLGSTTYAYNPSNQATYVADPNGNLVRYRYDERGLVTQKTVYTNRDIRPGEADTYTKNYTYNQDYELIETEYANGAKQFYVYDSNNTNPLARGNLIERIEQAPEAGGVPLPGSQPETLRWTYTYEPRFNQIRSETPPNGNAEEFEPANGGTNADGRYDTLRYYDYEEATLGDLNGDGLTNQTHGNVVKIEYPVVNAAGSPHPALTSNYVNQVSFELFTYNEHGQLLQHTNAAGLVVKNQYFPEGHETAGYLANVTHDFGIGIDPLTGREHRNEVTNVTRDALGNPVSVSSAGGNTVNFGVDSHCRITSMGASNQAATNVTWDKNHQIVSLSQQLDQNSTLSSESDFLYDVAGNLLRETTNATRPADAPPTSEPTKIVKEYGYDRKGNLVFTRNPNSVNGEQPADVESIVYDERNQVYTVTRGGVTSQFVGLAANSLVTVDAGIVNRTEMATTTNYYDPNGNLLRVVDPNGHQTQYGYDAFSRQVYQMDALGNVATTSYDPNGNVVEATSYQFTPRDSIVCMDELTQILATATGQSSQDDTCLEDPADRQYQRISKSIFAFDERDQNYLAQALRIDLSSGDCLPDGPLTPDDCYVGDLTEYDATGNPVRSTNDNLHTTINEFDRDGRVIKTTDALGNEVTNAYDEDGNLLYTNQTDRSGLTTPKTYSVQNEYDAWGRLVEVIDTIGQSTRSHYDVFGHVVSTQDANGQSVNSMYDLAGRLIQQSNVLRTGDNGEHTFTLAFTEPGLQAFNITSDGRTTMAAGSHPIQVIGGPVALDLQAAPSQARNTSLALTVRALDAANQTASLFTGNVTFWSTDDRAQLPDDYEFKADDEGTHEFQITMQTPGLQTILVLSEMGLVGSISTVVEPGPIERIQVLLPGETAEPGTQSGKSGTARPQVAGVPFKVTLNAVDDESNVVPVNGAVDLSSTDVDAVFGVASMVSGTAAVTATVAERNSPTITAEIVDSASITGTSEALTVFAPGNLDFTVPQGTEAGTPFTATVTARDPTGSIIEDYSGSVAFWSEDPAAALPPPYAFQAADQGQKDFTFTLNAPGTIHLGAYDLDDSLVTGASPGIRVEGPAVRFAVDAPPTATSGEAFQLTVTAQDATGNVATQYDGTVTITSTDPAAALPAAYSFSEQDAGVRTFSITPGVADDQWILVEDAARGISTTLTVLVEPGPAAALQVLLPGEAPTPGVAPGFIGEAFGQQAHVPVAVRVRAVDAQWNVVDSTETVHIDAPSAQLPADQALVGGEAVMQVTFTDGGPHAVTVSTPQGTLDPATSSDATVEAPANHLLLEVPADVHVGAPFQFTVKAKDANGAIRSSYYEYVAFDSSDTSATLPPQFLFQTYHNGVHSFSATFNTPGTQALIAYDGQGAYGVAYLTVVGGATHLDVEAPSKAVAGTPGQFKVTAWDDYEQKDASYSSTVRFVSSDPQATLPPDYAFTAGDVGTMDASFTLKTPGHHYVAAVDTASESVFGLAYVTVDAGPATQIQVLLPGEAPTPYSATGKIGSAATQRAGVPFEVTVYAADANGLPTTATTQVTLTSGDATASLPPALDLSDGPERATVILNEGGFANLYASSSPAGLANATAMIRVASRQYIDTSSPEETPQGSTASIDVTMRNSDGSVFEAFQGPVTLYVLDGGVVTSDSHTFTSNDLGVHSFDWALTNPGTAEYYVEEASGLAYPGGGQIQVTGVAAGMDAFATPVATSMESFDVEVSLLYAQEFVVSDYAGTVRVESSDGDAVLPGNYAFEAGDQGMHSFPVTLKTPGQQTVTIEAVDNPSLQKTLIVDVRPGSPAGYTVLLPGQSFDQGALMQRAGSPFGQMAGHAFTVYVVAVDANGFPVPVTETLSISGSATGSLALSKGWGSTQVTAAASGMASLVVSGSAGSQTSSDFEVAPAGNYFAIDAPERVEAYSPFNATITAHDADHESNTTFTQEVAFNGTDAYGYVPPDYLYTMGPHDPAKHGEVIGHINITYENDANGRVTRITDGNGAMTRYFYDEFGNKIRIQYADGTNATFAYDKAGNQVERRDPLGNAVRTTYDAANRPVLVEVVKASGMVGTDRQEFVYDGAGRVVQSIDYVAGDAASNQTVTRVYDSMGFLLREAQNGLVVANAYDGVGNRLSLDYASGFQLTYSYDELERLHDVSDSGGVIASFEYAGQSMLKRIVNANGVSASLHYDDAGRLTSLYHARGSNILVGFEYAYNPVGEIVATKRVHETRSDEAYELDSLYRLTKMERGELDAKHRKIVTAATGTASERTWDLDAAQNWDASTTTIDGVAIANVRTHNDMNQLVLEEVDGVNRTFVYDANGNLVDNGEKRFEWDFANRLRVVKDKATGDAIASYDYDTFNRRVARDLNGDVTRFVFDGSSVIEEWSNGEDARAEVAYIRGEGIDQLIAMDQLTYPVPDAVDAVVAALPGAPGTEELVQGACEAVRSCVPALRTRFFYHQDAMGSVYGVTDAAGRLVEGYRYDAFGEQTVVKPGTGGEVTWSALDVVGGATAIGNAYLFTGRRYDAESGLYNYRSRYYDAGLGRFISRDSIGVWGDGSNLGNGYAYVANNPVNNVDPMGTKKCKWYDAKCKAKKAAQKVKAAASAVTHAATRAANYAADAAKTVVTTVQHGANAAMNRITTTFDALATSVRGFVSNVASTIGDAVSNVVQAATNVARNVIHRTTQFVQSVSSSISQAVGNAVQSTISTFRQIPFTPPPLPALPVAPIALASIMGPLGGKGASLGAGLTGAMSSGVNAFQDWGQTLETFLPDYYAGDICLQVILSICGGYTVGEKGFSLTGTTGWGWGLSASASGGPGFGDQACGGRSKTYQADFTPVPVAPFVSVGGGAEYTYDENGASFQPQAVVSAGLGSWSAMKGSQVSTKCWSPW